MSPAGSIILHRARAWNAEPSSWRTFRQDSRATSLLLPPHAREAPPWPREGALNIPYLTSTAWGTYFKSGEVPTLPWPSRLAATSFSPQLRPPSDRKAFSLPRSFIKVHRRDKFFDGNHIEDAAHDSFGYPSVARARVLEDVPVQLTKGHQRTLPRRLPSFLSPTL